MKRIGGWVRGFRVLRIVLLTFGVGAWGMGRASAQTHAWTETRFPFRTIDQTRGMPVGILRAVEFGAEGGLYVGAHGPDHRWNTALGGALDLVGGEAWNLQFESVVDLVVDPGNDIGFNPRAFIWHEGLVLSHVRGEDIWQVGYVHRCKHDVDNLERFETTGSYDQRSIMLGSLMGRWTRLPIGLAGGEVRPLLQIDAFILRQDQRFPEQTRILRPSAEDHRGSLRAALEWDDPIADRLHLGMSVDVRGIWSRETSPARSRHSLHWDGSIELFSTLLGDARNLRAFLRHEWIDDTFVRTSPARASLTSIGLRLMP